MDFRNETVAALDALIGSGKIQQMIAEQLEKTVRGVIQSELRDYSDFAKQLGEAVKASLALNGDLDLPSYNETILAIVRKQVEHCTADTIQRQVAERMKELLEPPPESITLSGLVEAFIEQVKDKHNSGCVCYGEEEISFEVNRCNGFFRYIYLDETAGKTRHQCAIQIGVHNDEVFSLRLPGGDTRNQLFAGPFYGFEKMLFQMKAAGSKIVFDVDPSEIETSYITGEDH